MNPILKKMQYKNQNPVLMINVPAPIAELMAEPGIDIHEKADGIYEFVVFFALDKTQLEANLPALVKSWKPDSPFWICYPKGTSRKFKSDLSRDNIWELIKPSGLRPVSMVAVDNDWSAMRIRHGE